ncbi:hypothetical protein GCM10011503_09480 [Henriciella pelagia]|uniref:Transposase n=1 Tax=Henriciella pelagia TaxID=1977912 RepID=A0ABQ1J8T9_9PROT|nr:hypothetical protein GCM10011503_09480 [Henriciella pelagia]
MQLAAAYIDRNHYTRTARQQNIREPARRGPDIEAVSPRRINVKCLQRVGKLYSTA